MHCHRNILTSIKIINEIIYVLFLYQPLKSGAYFALKAHLNPDWSVTFPKAQQPHIASG